MGAKRLSIIVLVFCGLVIINQGYACNLAPTAILSAEPDIVLVDETVILDGSDSYDSDGTIVKYEWDFDYDGDVNNFIPDYNETSSNYADGTFDGITTYPYDTLGTYTVALRVTDDGNLALTDIYTCTINVIAPVFNLTQSKEYCYIQSAINEANNFDVIEVDPGTYLENIDFNGVNCTVRSTEPNNWLTVGATIIQAQDANFATVSFSNSEDANAVLAGFKITGGLSGIECNDTSATIKNCIIMSNGQLSDTGGGIYGCNDASPLITNCFIVDNDANYGAGIYSEDSSPVIRNCVISKNSAVYDGGGIYDVNSTVEILNCTLTDNNADNGGGLYCIGSLSDPNIVSCIFWDNEAVTDGNEIYNDGADPNFRRCDIKDSNLSGSWNTSLGNDDGGNIDQDPLFVITEPAYPNLVSRWMLDETEGAIAHDSAGGHNGTVTGALWETGILNGGIDLDGDQDYVDFGDIDEFEFGDSNFSISAWFYKKGTHNWNDSDPSNGMIVSKYNWGSNSRQWYLSHNSDGNLVFYTNPTGSSDHENLVSTYTCNSGQWFHVVAVRKGSTKSLYINSVFDVNGTTEGVVTGKTAHVLIGCIQDPSHRYQFFNGIIDDVRIYNKALSADDINEIFEYGLISQHNYPLDYGLVGQYNYRLDYNSPCVNAGNPVANVGNFDITNQPRICNARVDIGADEYCGVYNSTQKEYYSTIQSAIDSASNGDEIVVAQGHYYETLNFDGKPIHLRSTDPNDDDVVAATIIDANNASLDVVTFNTGESVSSILEGMTIKGGDDGIYISSGSSPTITKCTITGNDNYGISVSATNCSPVISRCRIINNTGQRGIDSTGAMTLTNCVIANNNTASYGYGVFINGTTAKNSVITNCTIYGHKNYGIFCNTTPNFANIKNCIIWNNSDDLYQSNITYSCIEDQDNGTGNIHAEPQFIDSDANDFHLWYSSPAIDAGDPNDSYSNEPAPNGNRINMGAYGNTDEATSSADTDGDGIADQWEIDHYLDPNDANDAIADLDGDGLRNIDEYYINWDPNSDDSGSIFGLVHNEATDINYPTISFAILQAENSQVITVPEGHYYETLNFDGKPIHLRSTDPNDDDVVAATIIDANNASLDVVTFNTGESVSSILEGMTIKGGDDGIYISSGSSPTITKCTITGNDNYGISVSATNCSPVISRCRIINNTGQRGIDSTGAMTLTNCVIANNNTASYGYGVFINGTTAKNSVITNCTIYGHKNYGIFCNTTPNFANIKNCIIWNNSDDLYQSNITYSCIEDQDNGTGNIHAEPQFIDSDANDFHLWYSSPAIDAGDPNDSYSNEPAPNGNRINMGAYGNTDEATSSADTDGDGIADQWEIDHYLDPNDANDAIADLDGDGLRNIDEYYINWDPNSDDSGSIFGLVHNEATDINYPTISFAILQAENSQVITVPEGHYYETLNFDGKPIHLRSTDPNDDDVVAATIIDANNASLDVVTFNTGESVSSILEGMTIKGGDDGIYISSGSSPTITKCTITGNDNYGISVSATNCSPVISRCRIINNTGQRGIDSTGAMTLTNCVIANNNTASYGYGVFINGTTAKNSVITNCTIYGHKNYGIFCNTTPNFANIKNCIIWNNSDDLYQSNITYSCIEDQDNGTGNIHAEPQFTNVDNNVFYLRLGSPAIDAGDPTSDFSKELYGGGGRIDMGAYGNTPYATIDSDDDGLPDGWEYTYWPNDDPNQHDPNDDSDSDGFTNYIEWLFDYDPTETTVMPLVLNWYAVPPYVPLGTSLEMEYLLNKTSDVTTTFRKSSGSIVRQFTQQLQAGLTYADWDLLDSNGVAVPADCYNIIVTAVYVSDPNETATFSTVGGSNTYPQITNFVVDNTDFDPYKNISATIDFDLSGNGKVFLEIQFNNISPDPPNRVLLNNELLPTGNYTYYWDGRDGNGNIPAGGDWAVYYSVPVPVNSLGVVVYRDPPRITELRCNQYLIVPTYREVSKISYTLSKNAEVTIIINDPDGNYFKMLLEQSDESAGSHEVIWNGTDDDGKFISTEGVYDVEITTVDPNNSDVSSVTIGTISAYR